MEIAIIGVATSLLVQWVKTVFKTEEWKTLAVVLVVSLLGAGLYTYLVDAGYWMSVLKVLVTAGAFYTYILSRF